MCSAGMHPAPQPLLSTPWHTCSMRHHRNRHQLDLGQNKPTICNESMPCLVPSLRDKRLLVHHPGHSQLPFLGPPDSHPRSHLLHLGQQHGGSCHEVGPAPLHHPVRGVGVQLHGREEQQAAHPHQQRQRQRARHPHVGDGQARTPPCALGLQLAHHERALQREVSQPLPAPAPRQLVLQHADDVLVSQAAGQEGGAHARGAPPLGHARLVVVVMVVLGRVRAAAAIGCVAVGGGGVGVLLRPLGC
mmetsp:Transcript_37067/g.93488  ORF Transcript_37067/g.93488 Transcript_37067/m.93488 type:complete len:246 (+) Transcript_37067:352-1089(+)